jgi:putative transposase
MKLHKSFRFRFYPTKLQAAKLASWENALRFLWNLGQEQRLMGLARTDKRYPSAFDQQKELTALRAELPWLNDVPRHLCDYLLKMLEESWLRCFRKLNRAPRWKKKGVGSIALTEPDPKMWSVAASGIRFPKLGLLRTVFHRPIEGRPLLCRISREGDQWFVSVVCELSIPDPEPRPLPLVALDRGVANAVADSDGGLVASPKFYARNMARLARLQRIVSRRQKGSKNRGKAKLKVAQLHRKVRRQRDHFVHVLSASYAKSHGTVAVENLNIAGMVRANRGLSRGILDSGWGKLVECLRYKLAWSGGQMLEVPAAYSSQTCSACGVVDANSRRSQSEFCCVACGHVDHADLNAAKVLKSRVNRSALTVEGMVLEATRRSSKAVKLRKLRQPKPQSSEVSS